VNAHIQRSRRVGMAALLATAALALAVAAAVSATAGSAAGRTSSTKASSIYDWTILGDDPLVLDKKLIRLQNSTSKMCLVYGSRPFGINLKWRNCQASGPNIFFRRKSGNASDPITFDEPVAIYVAGGFYLYYASRPFGINLKWSNTPKYDWQIRSLGGTGHPVPTKFQNVGFFNLTARDYVVYCTRPFGINLRWARDCGVGE
jgi:hypothetical protein